MKSNLVWVTWPVSIWSLSGGGHASLAVPLLQTIHSTLSPSSFLHPLSLSLSRTIFAQQGSVRRKTGWLCPVQISHPPLCPCQNLSLDSTAIDPCTHFIGEKKRLGCCWRKKIQTDYIQVAGGGQSRNVHPDCTYLVAEWNTIQLETGLGCIFV